MNLESAKRVLVVDDEPDVRSYLQAALEDAGFEVETAADGSEAMRAVARHKPDLISLDLVMPRHSGARFYHDLQKDRALSQIPVLIVTGHARDELGKADFAQMTLSGPGVYLEKPVSPGTYVSAVRQMLGLEVSAVPDQEADALRSELAKALADADRSTLQRMVDALHKK